MRAPNLHLPHPPRFGRLHLDAHHIHGPGNIWALMLAVVVAIAMLVGLSVSGAPAFHPTDVVPL